MGMKLDIKKFLTLKGAKLVVIGAAAGIILIILGFTLPSGGDKDESAQTGTSAPECGCRETVDETEEKLTTLIGKIDGAGSVYVAVTYENSGKSVYAYDYSGTGESVATAKASSSVEELLLEQVLTPEVRGVAVVCSGGDNPEVQLKIIRLISALLGISSQRICVTS